MAVVDRDAPEPVEVLVARASEAVASAALGLLGGAYAKRVVVVAGPGNNGADGRAAARILGRRGAAVRVLEAARASGCDIAGADLVIDAAFGTGLRRAYAPPRTPGAAVLAVDVPSGLSALDGEVVGAADGGGAVVASATVTFAALKPGLLLGSGPAHAGAVRLAGIGLDALAASVACAWLVGDSDVAAALPGRPAAGHKWQTALGVVAGSPGMTGAPWLVSRAAMRAGAGYVRLGMPGVGLAAWPLPPGEAVGFALPEVGWEEVAPGAVARCRAVVVGPGLGPHAGGRGRRSAVAAFLRACDLPAVVDADGLNALGTWSEVADVTAGRAAPTVLTPHEGEWARLAGAPPPADRIAAVSAAAAASGATVLLKGPVTVVADPSGRVRVAASGTSRLATAGTGDALSGVLGAFLARGMDPLDAAATAAHVHGAAAAGGPAEGLVAGDLPELVSGWLSRLGSGSRGALTWL